MPIYLINADDPRGERIVLWDDRFYGHIADHPSVTVEAILKTIVSPDIITRDVKYANRDNYYAKGCDPIYPNEYMKVCVEFASDMGKVITAYPTNTPKPNEVVLWQK